VGVAVGKGVSVGIGVFVGEGVKVGVKVIVGGMTNGVLVIARKGVADIVAVLDAVIDACGSGAWTLALILPEHPDKYRDRTDPMNISKHLRFKLIIFLIYYKFRGADRLRLIHLQRVQSYLEVLESYYSLSLG
jgi:hypothetical protein